MGVLQGIFGEFSGLRIVRDKAQYPNRGDPRSEVLVAQSCLQMSHAEAAGVFAQQAPASMRKTRISVLTIGLVVVLFELQTITRNS